jgi:hypothetical protein
MTNTVIVNAKQGQKNAKNAVANATKWLAQGHDAQKVALAIWNRYGFLTDVKGDTLKIWNIADIKIN